MQGSDPFIVLQRRDDLVGDLPRHRLSLLLRDILHEEDVDVLLVERKGVNLDDLVIADASLICWAAQYPSVVLWQAANQGQRRDAREAR
jgi:hypothetical protein